MRTLEQRRNDDGTVTIVYNGAKVALLSSLNEVLWSVSMSNEFGGEQFVADDRDDAVLRVMKIIHSF